MQSNHDKIKKEKQILRERQLELRQQLTQEAVVQKSKKINEQLFEIAQQKDLTAVHCFIPMGKEVDIKPFISYLLKTETTVVCPKTLKKPSLKHLILSDLNNVEQGRFGTVYPAGDKEYLGSFDLIIVPGLAFDQQGGRLGYGGGFYDNFLVKHPAAIKVGVGYDFQLMHQVPTEEHDVRLEIALAD